MSERTHEVLKKYLLELGIKVTDARGEPYYEVYSGDSEPIDIRLRKRHLEYLPDVVWERRGKPFIIEIALTEEWRSIVGEITLAHLAKKCTGILIVTSGWSEDYLNNLVSLVGDKLGITWYYINLEEEDLKDIERAKRTLRTSLKEWQLI